MMTEVVVGAMKTEEESTMTGARRPHHRTMIVTEAIEPTVAQGS